MAKARRTKRTAKKATAPPTPKSTGSKEANLTKGQIRKLNALRKSVGDEIGEKAFAEWLKAGHAETAAPVDKNAELIEETLGALVRGGKLRIVRGGYLLTRGRKRVIVERAVPQ